MENKLAFVLVLVMVVSVFLSACGPSTPSGTQGDPEAGKVKYASSCIACHGVDLKGLPGLGKDLTTSEFIKSKTNTELVAFVKTGRPSSDPLNTTKIDMPPKGGNPALTDDDILSIIAYIRSKQQ